MTGHAGRWAWADIDLDAVAHNVAVLRSVAAPSAVWAVVKADGYGHGAAEVSRVALAAGASALCVALASEGVALREAGIPTTVPILVLSEQPPELAADLVAHTLTPTVYTAVGVDAVAGAAADAGHPVGVHVKVDTGMHRVGVAPSALASLLDDIAAHHPWLRVAGVYTHLAVADEPDRPETDEQLARFDAVLAEHPVDDALIHAGNSAAALAHDRARRSFVRTGIALYGISPGPGVGHLAADLRPVLSLKARVSHVARLGAGERVSYGLRHAMPADGAVATVPLGYADGVRRNLSGTGTAVLIGGQRREIVGSITMDQLLVDCRDGPVAVGDEVVLIGRQGSETIRAEDWATTLGTIGYEVVCGIGGRVPRRYVHVSGGDAHRPDGAATEPFADVVPTDP